MNSHSASPSIKHKRKEKERRGKTGTKVSGGKEGKRKKGKKR